MAKLGAKCECTGMEHEVYCPLAPCNQPPLLCKCGNLAKQPDEFCEDCRDKIEGCMSEMGFGSKLTETCEMDNQKLAHKITEMLYNDGELRCSDLVVLSAIRGKIKRIIDEYKNLIVNDTINNGEARKLTRR